jgi:hypothetical protein
MPRRTTSNRTTGGMNSCRRFSFAMDKNKLREVGTHSLAAAVAVAGYIFLEKWDAFKALIGRLFS